MGIVSTPPRMNRLARPSPRELRILSGITVDSTDLMILLLPFPLLSLLQNHYSSCKYAIGSIRTASGAPLKVRSLKIYMQLN